MKDWLYRTKFGKWLLKEQINIVDRIYIAFIVFGMMLIAKKIGVI